MHNQVEGHIQDDHQKVSKEHTFAPPGVNIFTYFLHSVEGRVLNFHEYREEFWHLLTKEAENPRFLHEIWS